MVDYKVIKRALLAAGIKSYAPGEKAGTCTGAYAVIREAGTSPFAFNKTGYTLWKIHLYVPLNRYSELPTLQEQVQAALAGFAELHFTGNITPDIIDDQYKAHTRSIEYQVLRTLTK